MAFVLALLIVGWLLAFAIGAQTGFDNELEVKPTMQPKSNPAAPATYKNTASAS